MCVINVQLGNHVKLVTLRMITHDYSKPSKSFKVTDYIALLVRQSYALDL